MRDEFLSNFDKAINSIEDFLKMENSSSIVLKLYKSDKKRLQKRYPELLFMLFQESEEIPRKQNKYLISK